MGESTQLFWKTQITACINPCKFSLEKFSRWTFGNVLDQPDRLRTFVISKLGLAVIDQFVLARRHALPQDDERRDLFAIERIGNADSRCRSYGRMLIEYLVNLLP